LLVHGWGSRASHLAPLARILSSSGFKVIAFDMPAHSSVNESRQKDKSSMFEFCRAISSVVENIKPVYAIIGHSLGAASSAFDAAGYLRLADYKINVEKLVLISCPANLKSIIKGFSKNNGLNCDEELRLIMELENDFNSIIIQ
jgi:pimeloyl-ACP methyl ester carboxylesterase